MSTLVKQDVVLPAVRREDNPKIKRFMKRVTSPFLFRFFLLWKLPMAFFARLKVISLDTEHAKVTVPYGWLNQNPFKSTYFAVEAMAAEMSTGVLSLMAVDASEQPVSVIIIGMQSEFTKKATDLTTFHCTDGDKIFAAVEEAAQCDEPVHITADTVGTNRAGEVVARFTFTWSFKRKKG